MFPQLLYCHPSHLLLDLVRRSRAVAFLLLLHPVLNAQDAIPAYDGPFHIMGITLDGNKVTRPRVVLREMTLREGDTLTSTALYAAIARSRENLQNTGLFNTVAILPIYLGPTEVLLEVHLNERWYWWPSPILEVADPNFNTWWRTRDLSRLNWGFYINRYNSRGRNETGDLQFQFGYAQQYGLHYKVPFIDHRQRWGLSIGGGYYQQHEVTTATVDNERIFFAPDKGNARIQWNAAVELTLRRAHDLRHAWRLGYVDASVVPELAAAFPDHFGAGADRTGFLFLRYTIIHDNRDSRAYPLKGHFGELQVERKGFGLLSTQAPDITTFTANWSNWWPTSPRSILALSLRGKTTYGPPTPYFVQEGLGYRNYVRGYEYQVVDGQHYFLGKLNAMFQLLRPIDRRVELIPLEPFRTLHLAIYLNAFVDAGYVIDDQYGGMNGLDNTWTSGYGLGLDLVTSYDQVVRGELTLNAQGSYGFFLHFTNPF